MIPALSSIKWPCVIILLACAGMAGAEAQQKPQPRPQAAPRPIPVLKRAPVPASPVTDVLQNEPARIRRGINSDAGVPPSGVPVETMHAWPGEAGHNGQVAPRIALVQAGAVSASRASADPRVAMNVASRRG